MVSMDVMVGSCILAFVQLINYLVMSSHNATMKGILASALRISESISEEDVEWLKMTVRKTEPNACLDVLQLALSIGLWVILVRYVFPLIPLFEQKNLPENEEKCNIENVEEEFTLSDNDEEEESDEEESDEKESDEEKSDEEESDEEESDEEESDEEKSDEEESDEEKSDEEESDEEESDEEESDEEESDEEDDPLVVNSRNYIVDDDSSMDETTEITLARPWFHTQREVPMCKAPVEKSVMKIPEFPAKSI
ncbi:nucleoplasmin-like protein ANO39 [Penaeus japonicus]|uniref:nucleoplasmin-like protein ANO39 n=1 Tax=Penaeus japonicus TaxID=27405 RepID=UPI001C716975|nr:nucleoplasmin-like protein ANO39 [Penaeus japonicus]